MNPSFVPQAREWSCTHPETRRLRVGQSELPLPNEGVTAMTTSGAGSAFLRCVVRGARVSWRASLPVHGTACSAPLRSMKRKPMTHEKNGRNSSYFQRYLSSLE